MVPETNEFIFEGGCTVVCDLKDWNMFISITLTKSWSQQRTNHQSIIVNIFKVQWIESNLSSGQDVFMEIYRKHKSEIT